MKRVTALSVAVAITLLISTSAHALDIATVSIYYECDRTNDAFQEYSFEIVVEGTDIDDVVFRDDTVGVWYTMALDPNTGNWVYEDDGYNSLFDLYAVHANNNDFHFYFNEQVSPPTINDFEDDINLHVNVDPPAGFANITQPVHLDLNVGVSAIVAWDSMHGTSGLHSIGIFVEDNGGNEVYAAYYPTFAIQTNPIPLAYATNYTADVVGYGIEGGIAQARLTTNGDSLDYWGCFAQDNTVVFGTEVPEPMTFMLVGTGALLLLGVRRRRRMT